MRRFQLKKILIFLFFSFLAFSFPGKLAGQTTFPQKRSFIHYTDTEGLPYTGITDFFQDTLGFMWIATRISICRFDGYKFREYHVLDHNGEPTVLSNPKFFSNTEGDQLYVRSYNSRVFKLEEDKAIFKQQLLPFDTITHITNIQACSTGGFWLSQGSNIYYLDESMSNPELLTEHLPFTQSLLKDLDAIAIADGGQELFVLMGDYKLAKINRAAKTVQLIDLGLSRLGISVSLYLDSFKQLWFKGENSGLFKVDPETGTVRNFSANSPGRNYIPHNIVRAFVEDQENNMWIGTENGLCIWDREKNQIEYNQYDINDSKGLNSNAIYAICRDNMGNMWVGTYFGGINLYDATAEFFNVLTSGVGDRYLSGKHVSSIVEDSFGNIYVGLEGEGLNRINFQTDKIDRYCHIPGENSLSYDNVHALLIGKDQNLYIGTFTGGLNIYDPKLEWFEVINTKNTPNLPSDEIYSLFMEGDSIFIGTGNGVVVLDVQSKEIRPFLNGVFGNSIVESICKTEQDLWFSTRSDLYSYNLETSSLSRFDKFQKSVNISFVTPDKQGNIWIGDSFQGLHVYWRDEDSLHHYSPFLGFPAKRTFGMIQGQDGFYWVSSSSGLIKFFPETNNTVIYNQESGFPFSQFNYQAYYKTRSDELYFGGINGLIHFNEKNPQNVKTPDKVIFTDFELFNKSVIPGKKNVLQNPIHSTRSIKLKYLENVFTIHFSALDYIHPGRVQYAYYLEGFESEWNLVGNQEFATYTNLSPGKYTFHVKASYDNTDWSSEISNLIIKVAPPFWRSNLAFVIYGLLIVIALIFFYRTSVKIEKSRSMAMLEHKEKKHQERVNQLKLEFFTNISHELRTPLTLILGPLENLIRSNQLKEQSKAKLKQIHHNAQRLRGLVNQLLDFRRTESGNEKLQVRTGNIQLFAREIKEAFEDLAEHRQIEFDFLYEVKENKMLFDPDKVERILFNLLSNAFKYTPDQGKISVSFKDDFEKNEGHFLSIIVKDNGVGIPNDQLQHIYKRFYQAENPIQFSTGSGLGLAFVKSLVKLHKGTMEVESEEGNGSSFAVRIPVSSKVYSEEELVNNDISYYSNVSEWVNTQFAEIISPNLGVSVSNRPNILVVDDNQELLAFLQECLMDQYNVHTANNGIEAISKSKDIKPEIIISDIMMPQMDGLEFTKQMKENIETSHIPIILLTAKADVKHHYEGLSSGADFYIEKPFYPHLLVKHIENVLTTRRRLADLYKDNIDLQPSEITHSKADQDFIEKLTDLINDNIDNPDLDISFLLRHMHVSRSLLHLKLKKIVNCSATEYIRSVRLKKAARLILNQELSITEAAYSTGFSSPSLFSRRFKEYFGSSPREYLKEKLKS